MMDILMSETCWAHKKWNKIESDIKLVFQSSALELVTGFLWEPYESQLHFAGKVQDPLTLKGRNVSVLSKNPVRNAQETLSISVIQT